MAAAITSGAPSRIGAKAANERRNAHVPACVWTASFGSPIVPLEQNRNAGSPGERPPTGPAGGRSSAAAERTTGTPVSGTGTSATTSRGEQAASQRASSGAASRGLAEATVAPPASAPYSATT